MRMVEFFLWILSISRVSVLTGQLVRIIWPRFLIRFVNYLLFIKILKIEKDEAEKEIKEYSSVLECFTRKLKPGLRPVPQGDGLIVSPCDGTVKSYGPLRDDSVCLVKGISYKLKDFIPYGEDFRGGYQITIYLSPRDYHRVHHGLEAELKDIKAIPGSLFPVNDFSLKHVKEVFARNKRMVYEYERGVAMVMVGALNVGRIIPCHDIAVWKKIPKPFAHTKAEMRSKVSKAQEAGLFCLGSTVVLLFKAGVFITDGIELGGKVKMGQKIGLLNRFSQ